MARIAFFGLGVMGLPMARNLLSQGHTVVSAERGSRNESAFVDAGGELVESIATAVACADLAMSMLPDSPEVSEVALGHGGIIANASRDLRYVDMSTIRPDVSREIYEIGRLAGVPVLDAPVSGGEAAAVAGKLSIMVGGDSEDFDAVVPMLNCLGTTVRRVGGPGSGQTVKAANQLLVAGHLELLAEAIIFLEATEVDVATALEVIGGGLAGSAVLDRRGASMLNRAFTPGFRVALHHKDLGILDVAARNAGVYMPAGAAVRQMMAAANSSGAQHLDHTALVAIVDNLSRRHHGDFYPLAEPSNQDAALADAVSAASANDE